MKIKMFDEQHQEDLEKQINLFLSNSLNIEIIDIKYQLEFTENQYYCYTAMIIYKENKDA